MPLFAIENNKLTTVPQDNFLAEKELQHLIEANLETVFKCRFVASEFSTGAQHAGRIDTLALSEDNNPVIIEYKKVESSELINQSLYYLAWIWRRRSSTMTIAERVSDWLKQQKGDAFCDDCIKEKLALSRRQQAFRVTSALGTTREFRRQSGICSVCRSTKLVTRAL